MFSGASIRFLPTYTRYDQFETTYPYAEPFAGTPYENKAFKKRSITYPSWMDQGVDGYGHGIGIYRTHRLSKLNSNMQRNRDNIPYYIRRMAQGVFHASGRKLVNQGGRMPDPHRVPILTGHPSALTRFTHTEKNLIRKFPLGETLKDPSESYKEKLTFAQRINQSNSLYKSASQANENETYPSHRFTPHPIYRPYVANYEMESVKDSESLTSGEKEIQQRGKVEEPKKKSLRKRLFFMN